jgi:large subunit ribosomal protein L15
MKLHDLRSPRGARVARTRVGRGIAAGKGKTAGRGTKGQNSRTGTAVPTWHEGGQTPIHIRVPKLRGFKRRFKVEYEVVNVGRIAQVADEGGFADVEEAAAQAVSGRRASASADAPLTVNAEILRQVRLIGNVRRPLKILGNGEVRRRLFVVADAFTKSAREKIEAAGGTAQVLEIPGRPARSPEENGKPRDRREGRERARSEQQAAVVQPAEARRDERSAPDRGEQPRRDEKPGVERPQVETASAPE